MIRRIVVVLGVVATLSVAGAWAQMGMGAKKPSGAGMMSSEQAQGRCQEMAEARQEMHEKMMARQGKLDDLVVAMKTAEGSAKVDATATVVEELVSQRKAMHEHMMKMRSMMGGKAGGMGMGMMGDCPMMKEGAGPATEGSDPEDHSEHHPEAE